MGQVPEEEEGGDLVHALAPEVEVAPPKKLDRALGCSRFLEHLVEGDAVGRVARDVGDGESQAGSDTHSRL